jgi:endonuclease YncB( thermonuclease family)
MRVAVLSLFLLLSACGGGGDASSPVDVPTSKAPNTTASESSPTVATPTVALSSTAPNDNLESAPASVTAASSSISTYCGYATGGSRISGTVSAVHDGDTITVAGISIRLDSIDAPELSQAYGTQSRDNLAALVNGQQVTVTYAKKDKYGRVVGTVFLSDCTQVNSRQVATGSAWYYEAYKCEIGIALRNEYAAAQGMAVSQGLGLWASSAIAPWVYRNGVDATVPITCSGGDSPSWGNVSGGAVTSTPTTTTTPSTGTVGGTGTNTNTNTNTGTGTSTPTPTASCYMVWVNGYRRSNGTYVNGYYRRSPGCP